jgi:hypothetical protein
MASQEEQVAPKPEDTEGKDDTAEFSGAWDGFDEAEEAGQPATDAGRQAAEGDDKTTQGGDEAGQGEPEAGQPSEAPPAADADQPASREEIPDDVLANADPRLKAHIEQLEEDGKKARNAARSNGGRLAQALNELHALKQAASSGGTEGDGDSDEARKERLAKLREDFPEVSEPILQEITDLRGQVGKLTAGELARAETNVEQALEAEREALIERHPDLPTIVADPEYAKWAGAQSPGIQRIIQENAKHVISAADAGLVFDLFKQSRKQAVDPAAEEAAKAAAQKRADQLDAARGVTGSQPGLRADAEREAGSYNEAWDEFDAKDRRKAASRR